MAKTINAVFTSGLFTRTAKVFQWDSGDKLAFVNVDLPNSYQVHFANSLTGASKTVLGDSTGVAIPPEYFVPGSEIYAWVWLSTENGGYTKYQVTIPVYRRAQPQNVTPTPAQQTIIDQAIEALNQALETQITPEEKAKLAGIEAGAEVNDIEHIYATDPSTEEDFELPIGGLLPAKSVQIPDYLEIKTLDFTIDSNGDVTSGPLWSQVSGAGNPVGTKKTVLAKVTDSDGNIHTLPLTKFFEAPNVPPSYTFAGCGDDGKIRTIQEGSYADAWVYTEFDFDALIVGEIDAVFDNTGNRVDLLTTDKSSLVAAINEVAVSSGGGGAFWATYGMTSFADIMVAHNAGKAVFVKEAGTIYALDYVAAHHVTFSVVTTSANSAYGYTLKVTDANVWSMDSNRLALKSDSDAKYTKPSGGIPKTDLASAVQTSLGKADTALQSAIIPKGALASTSTATVMTATVTGITALTDGQALWLTNGVITSAAGVTLNINGLGAKPIYASQSAATAITTQFNVNYTALLIYNSTRVTGGCWDYVYGYETNTTYTPVKLGFGYATCSTAEATAAKTAALSSYTLTTGGIVSVKFTNAVGAGATLNINSKGAKAIYYQGSAITAGVIKAGDTATFIYSTYYHLIAIDRQVTKTSDLTNDSGFLTSYTETDPTVPSWAKASSKPTYTASEVGAIAAPSSPATGAFLVWNGTAWVAQTMAAWQGGNY